MIRQVDDKVVIVESFSNIGTKIVDMSFDGVGRHHVRKGNVLHS